MPQEPGPFLLASAADVAVEPGVWDFTEDALTLQGSVQATTAGWDPFIFDLDNLSSDIADVAIGVDLPGILSDLDFISAHLPLSYFDDMLQGFFDSQSLLNTATAFAPAQSWTDPGAAFVPPDSALVLVPPTVAPNAFVPAPNITVGAPPASGAAAVTLYNTTRIGATNFVVGDGFRVFAIGNPGDHLTATGIFNGEQLPVTDYGVIAADNQLNLEGVMGPENVGVWAQQWSVAGELLGSFNFIVSDS
jgi:hypothetical protein